MPRKHSKLSSSSSQVHIYLHICIKTSYIPSVLHERIYFTISSIIVIFHFLQKTHYLLAGICLCTNFSSTVDRGVPSHQLIASLSSHAAAVNGRALPDAHSMMSFAANSAYMAWEHRCACVHHHAVQIFVSPLQK